MRKLITRATQSDLVKTSALNAIANFVKIVTSLISSKVTAVCLGPAGVALLGQFINVLTMAMTFSGLGLGSGVTKYVAEHRDDPAVRARILSSALKLTVLSSLLVSAVIFFSRDILSRKVLHTDGYGPVFGVMALTLAFFALNAYLTAVLNGFKEFKKITQANIAGSLMSLAVSVTLVILWGLKGAFIGLILSQTLVFFVTLLFVVRSNWFRLENFGKGIDRESVQRLGRYALMAFTSLFAVTYVQLEIRNFIIKTLSIEQAGYWQGMIRISDIYLSFITTTLGVYYLPRLSEIRRDDELRREILKGFLFILPLTAASALGIFVLRAWIVRGLLADTFLPMLPLFAMQLLGDVVKIASWLLGYLLIAKAMTRVFIVTELLFGLSLYLLTRWLVSDLGLVGATYAFAANYVLYLLAMLWVFRKLLFSKTEPAR